MVKKEELLNMSGSRVGGRKSAATSQEAAETQPRSNRQGDKPVAKSMTILVVDDHALVREAFRLLLEDLDICREVITTSSGAEALAVLEKRPVDLALLDLKLRGESGLEILGHMKERKADLPVIVLSASESAGDVREAISHGADGYVVKSASADVLIHSINLVMTGQRVAPLPLDIMSDSSNQSSSGQNSSGGMPVRHHPKLTAQESRVLSYLGEGMSNKEIARTLGIFEGTVKVHVKSVFRKLGAKNRTMAALMATQEMRNQEQSS
jgi:two-component system, NarL family, nitrate/nitrite response regulator NarL